MNSAGSGSSSRAVGPGAFVLGDVGKVARRAQQFLAAVHLAGKGVAHPVDHRQLVFEVGDDRRDVRDAVEAEKRCPALEVDQDQVQRLG